LCPSATVTGNATPIANCAKYSLNYGETRCMLCSEGHILDSSRTMCMTESEAGAAVENCVVMDGVWCRMCKATFILTNENTCVTIPKTFFDKSDADVAKHIDRHCKIARFNDLIDYDKKLEKCEECEEGYTNAGTDCTNTACCTKDTLYSL